jgi:hypothetical protein
MASRTIDAAAPEEPRTISMYIYYIEMLMLKCQACLVLVGSPLEKAALPPGTKVFFEDRPKVLKLLSWPPTGHNATKFITEMPGSMPLPRERPEEVAHCLLIEHSLRSQSQTLSTFHPDLRQLRDNLQQSCAKALRTEYMNAQVGQK